MAIKTAVGFIMQDVWIPEIIYRPLPALCMAAGLVMVALGGLWPAWVGFGAFIYGARNFIWRLRF